MPLDARPSPGAGVAAFAGRQRPGHPIERTLDRRLTFAGLSFAAGFIALAAASLALPPAFRMGIWLPLHLALAGGAATAISALLPFFSATLAAAAPAPAGIRATAIVLVAAGAITAGFGHALGADGIAANGGVAFVAGIVSVGLAAGLLVRRALGVRRRLVERAYLVALLDVAIGVGLATGYLGGVGAIGSAWATLKPAHAWLNLFGFVGLVIAATLLHLAPTVSGTLIRSRRSSIVAVTALAGGPPIVALGYAVQADVGVRLGTLVVLAGASALAAHGIDVWRSRGRWTSDRSWHRFASWSLLAAPFWLATAAAIEAARALADGASPGAWRLTDVVGPLVGGFVLQTLGGAATHLLPAIGPGHPVRHAAQRRVLGTAAVPRFVAWNGAVGVLTIGALEGLDAAPGSIVAPLAVAGLVLATASTLALLVRAAMPARSGAAGSAG